MEAEKVVLLPTTEAGLEPLHFLKCTDPPLWLAPNPSLSKVARLASQNLFSTLKSFSPKSPFDHLLVDGFDAEQIWQQIDLQSQPILARVHRDLKRFEKNPKEISNLKVALVNKKNVVQEMVNGLGEESDDFEEDIKEFDEEEEEEDEDKDDEEGEENYEEDEEEEDGDTEKEESDDEDEGEGDNDGIEDGFLKIKELEKFMEEDEVREYGLEENKSSKKEKKQRREREEESDDDEDEEDDEVRAHCLFKLILLFCYE